MTNPDPTEDWLDRLGKAILPPVGMAVLAALLLIIPIGSLGVMAFDYLRAGVWDVMTLADVTGWQPATTEWIGLNQVIEWLIRQWVGFHSFAAGLLAMWIIVNADTL